MKHLENSEDGQMFYSQYSQRMVSRLGTLASITLLLASVYAETSFAADLVVLTFNTVGDSRQDPQTPDPSVVQPSMVGKGNCPIPSGSTGLTKNPGLSGQDCQWLQNNIA